MTKDNRKKNSELYVEKNGFSKNETKILEFLDKKLLDNKRRQRINAIADKLISILKSKTKDSLVWESLPLIFFGSDLPPEIRSSWVFVIKPNICTGAERHPNSHQRMMSFRGRGDLQVKEKEKWCSNFLVSTRALPLEKRWVSILPGTWHQAITGEACWTVVSFHTVPSDELIEERPTNNKAFAKRKYRRSKGA